MSLTRLARHIRLFFQFFRGSKNFTHLYLKLSFYAKEFLAGRYAFDPFAHLLRGSTKHVLVLTDNRSFNQFFQASFSPSSLWTCFDHAMIFNIVLEHISSKANAAAGYLSRIHVHAQIRLELRFNAQTPVRNVYLKMGMEVPINSVETFQYNCMPFRFSKNVLSKLPDALISQLQAPNPLDELDLADKMHSLDFRIEQQKKTLKCCVGGWKFTFRPRLFI